MRACPPGGPLSASPSMRRWPSTWPFASGAIPSSRGARETGSRPAWVESGPGLGYRVMVRERPLILVLLLAASFAVPGAAQACVDASRLTPFLHETLPALSPGHVAAEVEMLGDPNSYPEPSLEARIIAMIEGDYR